MKTSSQESGQNERVLLQGLLWKLSKPPSNSHKRVKPRQIDVALVEVGKMPAIRYKPSPLSKTRTFSLKDAAFGEASSQEAALVSPEGGQSCTFLIVLGEGSKRLVLAADTPAEKAKWLAELRKKLKNDPSLIRQTFAVAPTDIPASVVSLCEFDQANSYHALVPGTDSDSDFESDVDDDDDDDEVKTGGDEHKSCLDSILTGEELIKNLAVRQLPLQIRTRKSVSTVVDMDSFCSLQLYIGDRVVFRTMCQLEVKNSHISVQTSYRRQSTSVVGRNPNSSMVSSPLSATPVPTPGQPSSASASPGFAPAVPVPRDQTPQPLGSTSSSLSSSYIGPSTSHPSQEKKRPHRPGVIIVTKFAILIVENFTSPTVIVKSHLWDITQISANVATSGLEFRFSDGTSRTVYVSSIHSVVNAIIDSLSEIELFQFWPEFSRMSLKNNKTYTMCKYGKIVPSPARVYEAQCAYSRGIPDPSAVAYFEYLQKTNNREADFTCLHLGAHSSIGDCLAVLMHSNCFFGLSMQGVTDKVTATYCAETLRKNNSITKFVFRDSHFEDEAPLLEIMHSLDPRVNPKSNVCQLDFSGTPISNHCAKALGDAFRYMQHGLTSLWLDGCNISSSGLRAIFDSLAANTGSSSCLLQANFSRNNFDMASSQAMNMWLSKFSTEGCCLFSLELNNCNVQVHALQALPALTSLMNLSISGAKLTSTHENPLCFLDQTFDSLSLVSCDFDDVFAIRGLFDKILASKRPFQLQISSSFYTYEALGSGSAGDFERTDKDKASLLEKKPIASILPKIPNFKHNWIRVLRLRNQDLTLDVFRSLTQQLVDSKQIEVFEMSRPNPHRFIGQEEEWAFTITAFIHGCLPTLSSLTFSDGFSSDVINRVLAVFPSKSNIRYLDISNNALTTTGAQYLANVIQDNESLFFINCDNNAFGPSAIQAFAIASLRNHTLFQLDINCCLASALLTVKGDDDVHLLRSLHILSYSLLRNLRVHEKEISLLPESVLPFFANISTGQWHSQLPLAVRRMNAIEFPSKYRGTPPQINVSSANPGFSSPTLRPSKTSDGSSSSPSSSDDSSPVGSGPLQPNNRTRVGSNGQQSSARKLWQAIFTSSKHKE